MSKTSTATQAKRQAQIGLLLAGFLFAVSAGHGAAVASDPAQRDTTGATFVAHRDHGRLVIDRAAGLATAELVAVGSPPWVRKPFVLRAGAATVATLHRTGSRAVDVRDGSSSEGPISGRVEPSWENGAIRLSLRSADGQAFEIGVFERLSGGGAPERLSRLAETILDVRGSYQGTIVDAAGKSRGWLRLRVGQYGERTFEGSFPEPIGPGLAAAAALVLDTEVDWIEDHSLDVYRGT